LCYPRDRCDRRSMDVAEINYFDCSRSLNAGVDQETFDRWLLRIKIFESSSDPQLGCNSSNRPCFSYTSNPVHPWRSSALPLRVSSRAGSFWASGLAFLSPSSSQAPRQHLQALAGRSRSRCIRDDLLGFLVHGSNALGRYVVYRLLF